MHVKTRSRVATGLVGLLAVTGALLAPAPAFAAEPIDDPIRFDHGHIDAFALSLNEDGSVRLSLKEDVTGSHVERTPESVELFVKSQAIVDGVPAQYRPAGLEGAAYQLPLTQDPNLLWPGWDSMGVSSAYGSNAKIEIDVTDVTGPGDVFLWSQGPFGDPRQILTDAWKLPAKITQSAPAHVHSNWAFTESGTYTLTAQATVTSGDGTRASTTNSAEYTFVVAPAPTGLAIDGAAESVEPGAELTLTAAQTPAESTFSDFAWYTRADADAEWQHITDADGSELTVTAVDGAQYRATVSGGQDVAASGPFVVESPPVTVSASTAPVEPTVSIAPLAHHYHSGSPINLVATAEPEVADATYRWTVQRTDQDAPTTLPETGASTRLTAEQALTGASVRVAVLDADAKVLAESDAVTIDVDDHGAAPLQQVSISGLADHYHTGDTVSLTAAVDPASVLTRFEWYVQAHGETAPQLIAGEHDAEYEFEATEELAGAAVIAKLTYDDGRAYAESAPVIVHLDDHGHAIPDTDLSISTDRAVDDYWVGQTAKLTATQSTPTGLTEHRWLVKQPGSDEFVAVAGSSGAVYSFKPTLDNSGIQVKVELLHDGEVHAASAPVTVTAQQRPIVTELLVEADKPAYVAGETAQLTSSQNPDSGIHHYHWYVKRAGASDYVWVDQSRDADLAYPVTLEDDGAQLVIRLFDETHAVIAESAPHTLAVTAGGTNPDPVDTVLTIDGLADSYRVGDVAELSAVQTPDSGEDHFHWFIKRSGDADYSVISGALAADLSHTVAEGDHGAQIVAKLYDHDHAVIAESEPVELTVFTATEKPATRPATPSPAALDGLPAGGIGVSTSTPVAGQVITVQVGGDRSGEWVAAWLFSEPVLLGGDWTQVAADGTIAVTIPADTTPGAHRLAVFDAAGAVVGWQELQVSAAAATPAGDGAATGSAALASTGAEISGVVVGGALLLLLGAASVIVARRRSTQN